jgi:hypothetical protein
MSADASPPTEEKGFNLPTLYLRPTCDRTRPAGSDWQGRTQVHSDDDGNTHLLIPCQGMEVTIFFGDEADELERLVKLLQERIEEIKEREL